MKVQVDRSFSKDLRKIKAKNIRLKTAGVIERLQKINKISQVSNLKPIKGFKGFYRIRIGDYRLGLELKGNTLTLIRLLHRKDIYKYFP